jgi:hypothetical protein
MKSKQAIKWVNLVLLLALVSSAAVTGTADEPQGIEPSAISCGDSAHCSMGTPAVQVVNHGVGPAIKGRSAASKTGIRGVGQPGVKGSSGGGNGVEGYSSGGFGIFGTSEDREGVRGISTGVAIADNGVYGETNTDDPTEAGVYGRSTDWGSGVRGDANGSGIGVMATSATSHGTWSYAEGATGNVYGIHARSASSSGWGVYGYASSATGNTVGVYGFTESSDGIGVVGLQAGGYDDLGAYYAPGGYFGSRNGLLGATDYSNGGGVIGIKHESGGAAVAGHHYADSGDTRGVEGYTTSPDGWAGYFFTAAGNGVYISAPPGKIGLNVASGTKNAVVATDDGSRLLYAEEATEVWFSDHGFGQLQDGVAAIAIDPVYAQTVNLSEPYHVFVQVYGGASVYVSSRTPTGFEVHLWEGDPNVEFSYEIKARRLGYESVRLERAPWADSDPNLYPETGVVSLSGADPSAEGSRKIPQPDTSPPPPEDLPE